MHHLPPLFCSFSRCFHNGQEDSVKRASPNREMLFRTHRPSAQMSAMRMDRDRKSWHSWERSSTDRRSAVRAMIRDVARGQHWTVIFLLSLALQPQVSRRLRAIFSRSLTCFDFFSTVFSLSTELQCSVGLTLEAFTRDSRQLLRDFQGAQLFKTVSVSHFLGAVG